MPPAHVRQCRVALGGRGIPVQALPLGTEELAERVPAREAYPYAVGAQPLDRRGAQILRLTDAHGEEHFTVRCSGGASCRGASAPSAPAAGALEPHGDHPHTVGVNVEEARAMALFRKKSTMPTADDALPGRSTP